MNHTTQPNNVLSEFDARRTEESRSTIMLWFISFLSLLFNEGDRESRHLLCIADCCLLTIPQDSASMTIDCRVQQNFFPLCLYLLPQKSNLARLVNVLFVAKTCSWSRSHGKPHSSSLDSSSSSSSSFSTAFLAGFFFFFLFLLFELVALAIGCSRILRISSSTIFLSDFHFARSGVGAADNRVRPFFVIARYKLELFFDHLLPSLGTLVHTYGSKES